jgi:hypothetical protein
MAVVALVVLRGVTPEQYDAVRAATNWANTAADGGLSHVSWFEGDDCHSVDAWVNEEAWAAFAANRLGPAVASAGASGQPEVTVHEAHDVVVSTGQTATTYESPWI